MKVKNEGPDGLSLWDSSRCMGLVGRKIRFFTPISESDLSLEEMKFACLVIENFDLFDESTEAEKELRDAAEKARNIADRCNNAMLPDHIQELLKSIQDTLDAAL